MERMRWMCLLLIYGYVNEDIVQVVNEAHEFMLRNENEKVRQIDNARPAGEKLGVRHKTSEAKKPRDEANKLFRDAKRIYREWEHGFQQRHGIELQQYFKIETIVMYTNLKSASMFTCTLC